MQSSTYFSRRFSPTQSSLQTLKPESSRSLRISEIAQKWQPQTDQGFCLFEKYRPKPGGQTRFWEVVPFNSIEDIPYRAIWLRGGIGSGKSHVGAAFICTRAFLDPTSRGLITANSYSQLETSSLIALAEFCKQFNIPISPKRSTVEETAKAIAHRRLVQIFDASLLVLSAEAFMGATTDSKETGRGLQIRYFWGDELAYSSKSAWDTLNGRLGRGAGNIKGLGVITSSINRNQPYNYCFDLFDDPDRAPDLRELYLSINCLTEDNDSLDADYAKSLSASYTDELAAIELRGEYAVNTDGLLFNYFDRGRHCLGIDIDPGELLYVSFDFNRHPATAILANVINDRIIVAEEFYLLHSDTFKLAAAVRDRIAAINPPRIYVFGDASGRAKTANSEKSNWSIVEDAFRDRSLRFLMQVEKSNPEIVDTVNSVNSLFKNDRLIIHPRCRELVKDMEYLRDDGRGGIEKKRDPMRSHLADCCRYLCNTLYPYKTVNFDWIID